MKKLMRIDFDNIGEKIDYFLFNNEFEKAQNVSDIIKLAIKDSLLFINDHFNSSKILLIGADDILFSAIDPSKKQLQLLKDFFYSKTNFTISIGVGDNVKEAIVNLREAKVSGKNLIKGIE